MTSGLQYERAPLERRVRDRPLLNGRGNACAAVLERR